MWSQWEGYLPQPRGQALQAAFAARGIPLTQAHTSGHASVRDGELLTPYAITANREDGTRLRATTIIDKGGPPGRFVAFTVLPPAGVDAGAGEPGSAGASEAEAAAIAPSPPPATF